MTMNTVKQFVMQVFCISAAEIISKLLSDIERVEKYSSGAISH